MQRGICVQKARGGGDELHFSYKMTISIEN
jgi:hypothetical protein